MIRSLLQLLRATDGPVRRRILLLALAGVLAFGAGFLLMTPVLAEQLIARWGYFYMLGLFAGFVWMAYRVAAPRRAIWSGWLRRPGWTGAGIALAALCAIWIDPFKHKVLFDEYVLQGTAFHIHATKEIGTTYRAYDIAGTWLPIDTFVDKRPYFFAFLVSLLHDLTGYRIANIFALNVALTPLCLGLVYWLAQALTGRRAPALLAIALLATLPLFGQQSSGAGMELHNLTMIVIVMTAAVLYLRAPDDDRLGLLVLGAVLLAQSRYESVIFVVPVAVVILAGWLRAGRVILPWPAIVAPLLLVPYAWHNRVLSATPALWQLHEGQTSRFALRYLPGNLEGAWRFFFNTGVELANSWWLSVLGTAAAVWLLGCAWRFARDPARGPGAPAFFALIWFGAGIVGNLTMLMFYYWSRLDEVIASRFALPVCFLLALFAACFVRDLDARRLPGTRLAAFGLLVWGFVCGLPAIARRPYTDQNLVMQEVEWEHEILLTRPGPVLFITDNSSLPFVLWRIPALISEVARLRGEQIAYHLKETTFKEVLVAQALRPTSAAGERGVDPKDFMPENFRLESIAEKRFGIRWIRMSRVVAIDPAKPGASEPVKTAKFPADE